MLDSLGVQTIVKYYKVEKTRVIELNNNDKVEYLKSKVK